MLRKLTSLTLLLVLLLSIVACANNSNPQTQQDSTSSSTGETNQTPQHTEKKISGNITAASVFSEGLAFVTMQENEEITYCINQEGYIVFELDVAAGVLGEIRGTFVNGLALIDGGLCDKTGKITYPEDVGATAFSDLALDGNYIIAERITSDYNSSKKELGVMNTSFEWVLEPTEELYIATGGISDIPLNTSCFYNNGWFYFDETKKYLNLSTGEISEAVNQALPSKQWRGYDNSFYDYDGNVMLDLSRYNTLQLASYCNFVNGFINGKAPVRFINTETNKYYFSLIDEQGELLFEPVETIKFDAFDYDGEHILVIDYMLNPKEIQCFDTQGNLLGQINLDTISKNKAWECTVSDGIICLSAGYNFNYTCYYLKTDMSPLF